MSPLKISNSLSDRINYVVYDVLGQFMYFKDWYNDDPAVLDQIVQIRNWYAQSKISKSNMLQFCNGVST